MASVNKVILVGNLGRDPEVRHNQNGGAICSVSIATTSQWNDKNSGEKREETEWHRVVFYNRLAEIAGEYLRKGRQVYIEGRLKTRKYQDKDSGTDRYVTEIVADQMQMLGGRDDGGGQSGGGGQQRNGYAEQRQGRSSGGQQQGQQAQQTQRGGGGGGFADMDDDIPFMRLCHGASLWAV